jgi:hypothetical protein
VALQPASLAPIKISKQAKPETCELIREERILPTDKLSSSANYQSKTLKSKAGTRLTGVVRHVELTTQAVVIAEDWPTWLIHVCRPWAFATSQCGAVGQNW